MFLRNIDFCQFNTSSFSHNKVVLKAGAVALNLNVSSSIYHCEFNANVASGRGTITFDTSIRSNVDSVLFLQNTARGTAGAVSIELGDQFEKYQLCKEHNSTRWMHCKLQWRKHKYQVVKVSPGGSHLGANWERAGSELE